MTISEVKQQVENALIVTAIEFGKMEKEKIKKVQFKDTSVENVVVDPVNRQSYQLSLTILEVVKSA